MWPENMTDDAEAIGYCGCEPFLPGEDYDPMYEGYDDTPKCGGCWRKNGDGCRRCSPPDRENKPTGFGIEGCEHAPVYRLGRELKENASVVLGCRVGGPVWFRRYLAWTGFDLRRERVSDRVWDKFCDECDTHSEAVRRYTAWAKKVTKS